MSILTTTIKVRGALEDAQTKLQVDLEIEIPIRPLAAITMALSNGHDSPKQGDVDTMVRQVLED
jgi:hypothetical protein